MRKRKEELRLAQPTTRVEIGQSKELTAKEIIVTEKEPTCKSIDSSAASVTEET